MKPHLLGIEDLSCILFKAVFGNNLAYLNKTWMNSRCVNSQNSNNEMGFEILWKKKLVYADTFRQKKVTCKTNFDKFQNQL